MAPCLASKQPWRATPAQGLLLDQGASPDSLAPLWAWSVYMALRYTGFHDEPPWRCQSPCPVSSPVNPKSEQSQTVHSLQSSVERRASVKCLHKCPSNQGLKGKHKRKVLSSDLTPVWKSQLRSAGQVGVSRPSGVMERG